MFNSEKEKQMVFDVRKSLNVKLIFQISKKKDSMIFSKIGLYVPYYRILLYNE